MTNVWSQRNQLIELQSKSIDWFLCFSKQFLLNILIGVIFHEYKIESQSFHF